MVREYGGGRALIDIDRHFAQEGTSGRAFDGLRQRGLKVRHPDLTVGTRIHHGLSTLPGRTIDSYAASAVRNLAMRKNCANFGVRLFDIDEFYRRIECFERAPCMECAGRRAATSR